MSFGTYSRKTVLEPYFLKLNFSGFARLQYFILTLERVITSCFLPKIAQTGQKVILFFP